MYMYECFSFESLRTPNQHLVLTTGDVSTQRNQMKMAMHCDVKTPGVSSTTVHVQCYVRVCVGGARSTWLASIYRPGARRATAQRCPWRQSRCAPCPSGPTCPSQDTGLKHNVWRHYIGSHVRTGDDTATDCFNSIHIYNETYAKTRDNVCYRAVYASARSLSIW